MVSLAGAAAAGANRNVIASGAGAGSVSDITDGKPILSVSFEMSLKKYTTFTPSQPRFFRGCRD